MTARLRLALEAGLDLPSEGRIAVLHPAAAEDLSPLPADRLHVIQPFRPDHDAFAAQGIDVAAEPEGRYAATLVFVPRSKPLARALVARAAAMTDGPVAVDGMRTAGVEGLLREIRARTAVEGPVNKSHGKLFWFAADPALFADWTARPGRVEGFATAPGVFSADGVDPASRLLADALPDRLGPAVADLGAGWGYLSARILAREGVQALHLVEADRTALDCARANVTDPRAVFHWADATRWRPPAPLDAVVTNPPFHAGRAADPSLGRAFISAAAAMLRPAGTLWMVANRHLPYEETLAAAFRRVEELPGSAGFKLIRAERPLAPMRESR